MPVPTAADGSTPIVSEIEWVGVSALPTSDLEQRVLTTAKSWKPWAEARPFAEATLREDVSRITDVYRSHGYYEASAAYELTWTAERNSVSVRFVVEEGEPVLLEAFDLTISEHPQLGPAERLSAVEDLPLQVGRIFGVELYRRSRQKLLRRLAELGFPGATLTGGAEVELAVRAARVRWSLDPGPLVRFGPVRVAGLEEIGEDIVLRELTFDRGQTFSQRVLEESQQRVYDLGLFRSVSLHPGPPRDDRTRGEGAVEQPRAAPLEVEWPIEVEVEERPPKSVSFGLGYGTEDQLRVQAGWQHRNLFGRARSLEVSAKYSSLLYGTDATFRQRHWLRPLLELEISGSARRESPPAYDADRFGAGVLLRRPLSPHWKGRLGFAYEYNSSVRLESDVGRRLGLPENSRLSTFEFGLRRVQLDDTLEPRRGTWLDLSLSPSLRGIGSDLDYLRAMAEGRAYLPVRGCVLAFRLRTGTLEPFGGSEATDVPLVSRFYSGGSTSVRGFEFQKLGPLDEDEDPLGGLSLAEGSAELRFPIWGRVSGVVFTDAGQLSLDPSTIRGGDFYYSAGAGIRVRTPLGPLRLDYGHLLNPPSGIGRSRFYLSVGHAF
jgi:outer membrane protein assembly complex protein YaeT